MKKKNWLRITIITLAILALTISVGAVILNNIKNRSDTTTINDVPGSEPPYNFDYSWADNNPYIAHAMDGIMGKSYTNSYEAFLLNYQLGHRIFEVDFFLTDDGYNIAAHDAEHWRNNATIPPDAEIRSSTFDTKKFTYDNFMSSLWYGEYHAIDLSILFDLLQEYPDVYIVTDTKYSDETNVRKQFSSFVEAANAVDPSLLDRFIIQIYNQEMLDWVMDVHAWKSIIYTLYQDPNWTPENVLAFSESTGVKFITMWDSYLTPEISKIWKPANIRIATHTLNSLARAKQSRTRGADVIYTDFLIPQ